MGNAGRSGSMFTGVTYNVNSGAALARRNRQIPDTVENGPALNSTRTHGEYRPGSSRTRSRPAQSSAERPSSDNRIARSARSSVPFTVGPGR